MSTHIALLRGINVGGHRMVSMADLRSFLTDIGLRNAQSLLQSGNLVFDAGRRSTSAIEKLLETEAAKRLELATDFYVYTADDWRSVIERNPMPDAAKRDPSHFIVLFLKAAPDERALRAALAGYAGPETVRASGKQLYIVYPLGMGKSRLSAVLTEKTLGTRGTARNWNTVLKLAAAAATAPGQPSVK
jgi:uncharacterized protein (DUF1697 family)